MPKLQTLLAARRAIGVAATLGFLLVAFYFVHRSFYGMRIPLEANTEAESAK